MSESIYAMKPGFLHARADRVCRAVFGDKVYVRGLIEASNSCMRDCLYCGIRHGNKKIARYSLGDGEILASVSAGFAAGIRSFVIQGAEDPAFGAERLAALAGKIKSATFGEAALTYSFGTMSRQDYAMLQRAGCDRYLLRFETSDEKLHLKLRFSSLARRLEALEDLASLGFEVGSGFMTGLPGAVEGTMEADVELCRRYGFDMVGIGPFIPHPDTPLAGEQCEGLDPALDACAAVRIALPFANMPATTAAGSIAPDGRERMLACGANVLMPNIGPVDRKKDYELYPGKICLDEDGMKCLGCLGLRVKTIGKNLSMERGDSPAVLKRKKISLEGASPVHPAEAEARP